MAVIAKLERNTTSVTRQLARPACYLCAQHTCWCDVHTPVRSGPSAYRSSTTHCHGM